MANAAQIGVSGDAAMSCEYPVSSTTGTTRIRITRHGYHAAKRYSANPIGSTVQSKAWTHTVQRAA